MKSPPPPSKFQHGDVISYRNRDIVAWVIGPVASKYNFDAVVAIVMEVSREYRSVYRLGSTEEFATEPFEKVEGA